MASTKGCFNIYHKNKLIPFPYATKSNAPLSDTGCSHTLVRLSDAHLVSNITPGDTFSVNLPNGDTVQAQAKAELIIPNVPGGIQAYIFADNTIDRSLISTSDLCNKGCTAIYTSTYVHIVNKQGKTVHYSTKAPKDKLWTMVSDDPHRPIQRFESYVGNVIKNQYDAEYVNFISAMLGNPAHETILRSIRKGYLKFLPRLTTALYRANMPNSSAIARGHTDRKRQGLDSTQPKKHLLLFSRQDREDYDLQNKDDTMYVDLVDMTRTSHADLTGRFPVASRQGNEYIFICCYLGYIMAVAQCDKTKESFIKSTTICLEKFTSAKGITHTPPLMHRIDNEVSQDLKDLVQKHFKMELHLVSPTSHRQNHAERAIRTYKNHLIATMCSAHPNAPYSLWESYMPQIEITLNCLLPFRINPNISAWEGIHGKPFNFRRHPLAPCGTEVLIYEPPDKRTTWEPHGKHGFYCSPSLEHYRTFRVYTSSTQAFRVTDTVAWLPSPYALPGSSPAELLQAAIQDFSNAIKLVNKLVKAPQTRNLSLTTVTNRIICDLLEMAHLYHGQATPDTVTEQRVRDPIPDVVVEPIPIPVPVVAVEPIPVITPAANPTPVQIVVPLPVSDQRVIPPVSAVPPPPGFDPLPLLPPVTIAVTPAKETRVPKPKPKLKPKPRPRLSKRKRTANQRYAAHVTSTPKPAPVLKPKPISYDPRSPPIGAALRGEHKHLWLKAMHEEFERLVETETLFFIRYGDKPNDRIASYCRIVAAMKLKLGQIIYRIRATYGSDKGDFVGDTSAFVAEFVSVKMLINAGLSEKEAKLAFVDIKNYFLNSPLAIFEYMRVPIKYLPQHMIEKYNLEDPEMLKDGYVMVEIRKSIYGLKQAGRIAQELLYKRLAADGYFPSPRNPGLISNADKSIVFTLMVDDFGVKYKGGRKTLQKLLDTLEKHYEITVDYCDSDTSKYLGMTIKQDHVAKTTTISMPGYVQSHLDVLGVKLTKPTHNASVFYPPEYGKKGPQYEHEDDTALATPAQQKQLQQICGIFNYYAAAVDPTMIVAISRLSSQQAKPTVAIWNEALHFLQYAATHPDAEIVYHASDMQLRVISDASYLSETGSRSRAGGVHYLGWHSDVPPRNMPLNGGVLFLSRILPTVCSSAAEAEYGALFLNGGEANNEQAILEFMGYPQGIIPIIGDNQCAIGIANNTVKPKRSKSFSMQFHWIQDRVALKQFIAIWDSGSLNIADFLTKIHPTKHFKEMRDFFLKSTGQPKLIKVPNITSTNKFQVLEMDDD